jgi:hypothetical protein
MDRCAGRMKAMPLFSKSSTNCGMKIKRQHIDPEAMRKEAIQVAAMAMRFVADVCKEELPQ